MTYFSSLARRSRLWFGSRAHAPARRPRFFSEQSQSPSGRGKEKVRDIPGGAGEKPERSPHAQWYADTVPAMIPVALLGSAVYIGLKLLQTNLATEKYFDEANARIRQLEAEVEALRREQEIRESQLAVATGGGLDAWSSPSRWWWFA